MLSRWPPAARRGLAHPARAVAARAVAGRHAVAAVGPAGAAARPRDRRRRRRRRCRSPRCPYIAAPLAPPGGPSETGRRRWRRCCSRSHRCRRTTSRCRGPSRPGRPDRRPSRRSRWRTRRCPAGRAVGEAGAARRRLADVAAGQMLLTHWPLEAQASRWAVTVPVGLAVSGRCGTAPRGRRRAAGPMVSRGIAFEGLSVNDDPIDDAEGATEPGDGRRVCCRVGRGGSARASTCARATGRGLRYPS